MPRYGWMIYWDELDKKPITIFGPACLDPKLRKQLENGLGEEFVLRDDDQIPYYKGRLVGAYTGFEPLDDYGVPNDGCTEVLLNGELL